jgi:endogenous inhibitor of DNA gyrase (YacG/DUF329 family)
MEAPWAPFCSQRCKDVDLGRWLNGDYRIPDDRPELPADDAESSDEAGPLQNPEG